MRSRTPLVVALAFTASCGDPYGPSEAFRENRTDTLSLYALSGTPIALPSAYSIFLRQSVRPDLAREGFDFAFDIDTVGRPVLLPTGALGLGRGSGIQLASTPFDSLRIAPTSNYQRDSAVAVDSGSVAILHSRQPLYPVCVTNVPAFYAKLEILAIDTTSGPNGRRVDFRILTDINCGYRGLEPGLPRQ